MTGAGAIGFSSRFVPVRRFGWLNLVCSRGGEGDLHITLNSLPGITASRQPWGL